MKGLWLMIIGMAVVTYIPRMLPMVLLPNIRLPRFLNRFLKFVPFAALGSLIFPGILSSTGSQSSAIVGGILSIVLALFRVNLMMVVFGGIVGAFLWDIL